jgi:hypothetical protein
VIRAIAFWAVGPGAFVAAGDDGPVHPFPPDRSDPDRSPPDRGPDLAPLVAPKPSAKEVIILVLTFCVLPALVLVFIGPPLLSLR